ncbi:MAG: response regulator [Saprospiraceae bacterium]|nr:response regulator [Pyrinomonadaceae bacterium]
MSKRKLLLADDSITIQKVVNLTFAEEGIEVIAVGDGDAAVDAIAGYAPHIVLADVHMPGKNGYQICEMIRQNEDTKDIPVILLVGSFEPFDEEEANRVGASAYLTKPFQSIRELVAQVSDLLIAAETPPEEPETDDIESLYRQSFAETVDIPDVETAESVLADDGFDDEMIETSFAESEPEYSDDDDFGAAFPQEESSIEFEPLPQGEPPAEESSNNQYSSPFDAPAYDDLPAADPETEGESEAEGETTHEPAIFEEPDEKSTTELSAAQTVSFNAIPSEVSQPAYAFEDLDLLELPDFSEGKTIEFATPADAVVAGGNKQVVSLSPELMEIIVQKVVEKLAEKY